MPRLSFLLSAVLFLATAGTAAASAPVPLQGFAPGPAQPLDLDRYMGHWYVIARVPSPVERGHAASVNEYRRTGEDGIQVLYHYREGLDGEPRVMTLRASARADSGYRRWRTWYYRIIPTRSEVLEVATDYSWALVGQGGRAAWILARDPGMDRATYRALQERLAAHGYDTDRMRRVVHQPDQLGQLGFENPRAR